ncbi:MAG: methionine aminotransferase [Saprospiraceae bacterium]
MSSTPITLNSKLPTVGTTIFSVMSQLAKAHEAINLSQGFPDFDCDPALMELVNQYMNAGKNQYAPMTGVPALTEQIAQKIEKMYGAKLSAADEITITVGATQAIFTIISSCIQVGEEVILIEPAYDSYRPSIELCGGVPVCYELTKPDFKIDWDHFKALVTSKTKMIIINTPHNPTGSILTATDLEALQALTRDTNIIVLSDEVYEHLIYDGVQHESVLRYPELLARSFVTFSFGKTFHATGWRVGYCVAPKYLMKEFRKVHQFNVFTINTPTQYALADYLKTASNYLGLGDFFQKKRDYFLSAISTSRFKPIPCQGTYFQLVDYSAISLERDVEFAKRITKDYRVAAIPISVFYSSGRNDHVIRFCFAKKEETLAAAAEMLCTI